MPIVSSAVTQEGAQIDGRRWTTERHTDHLGVVYVISYLAAADLDVQAALATRAAALPASMQGDELAANLNGVRQDGSSASPVFNYSTVADLRDALRTAYRSATKAEAIMIGDFLAGLTNAQLQALFSMTSGQVTTLRTNKLTPAATAAASLRTATGA